MRILTLLTGTQEEGLGCRIIGRVSGGVGQGGGGRGGGGGGEGEVLSGGYAEHLGTRFADSCSKFGQLRAEGIIHSGFSVLCCNQERK